VNDPLSWIAEESAAWSARGLTRTLSARGATTPGRFICNGREILNFGSNDYLGLASDERLIEAAGIAAKAYGWGAGASPLVSGWTDAHKALVDEIRSFEQTEAAMLFPTGYAANLGTIAALVGKEDVVYSDRLNHACLIDGARLSGATVRVYPHADAGRLGGSLERDAGCFRRRLIVTDGVFSMDGDLGPIDKLVELAEHFDSMLMVDEAHGTGVFGADGRGACSAVGVSERVPIKVGTLSKALGSIGGFVAGSDRLIRWLTNHARSQIYSTALPPAAVAAAQTAIEIVRKEPWRREHVHALSGRVRAALRDAGLDVGMSTGPIVPVIVGDVDKTMALSGRLLETCMFAPAIRPPTVPEGTARLRVSLSAAHTEADADRLIAAILA
jgi:8-amino-7-oxononanoate synthase